MAEQYAEITEAEPLVAGDEIRFHFKVTGITFLTAAHIALMESRLEKETRFTVIRHSIPKKTGAFQVTEMTMDVRVEPQLGYTGQWMRSELVVAGTTIAAGVIAKVIIGALAGILIMITVAKIEKLIPSAEQSKAAGDAALKIGAVLIAVYLVYKFA